MCIQAQYKQNLKACQVIMTQYRLLIGEKLYYRVENYLNVYKDQEMIKLIWILPHERPQQTNKSIL